MLMKRHENLINIFYQILISLEGYMHLKVPQMQGLASVPVDKDRVSTYIMVRDTKGVCSYYLVEFHILENLELFISI